MTGLSKMMHSGPLISDCSQRNTTLLQKRNQFWQIDLTTNIEYWIIDLLIVIVVGWYVSSKLKSSIEKKFHV